MACPYYAVAKSAARSQGWRRPYGSAISTDIAPSARRPEPQDLRLPAILVGGRTHLPPLSFAIGWGQSLTVITLLRREP